MIIVTFTTKHILMSTSLLVAVENCVLDCCRVPVTVIKPASVVKGPATAPGQTQAGAPAAALDALRVPGMPGSIFDTQQDSNTADVVRVIGEVLVWTHELLLCTALHSTAQHSTTQYCTPQHSMAQHSTAQHTAQDSPAQPIIADVAVLESSSARSSHLLCFKWAAHQRHELSGQIYLCSF